MRGDIDIEAAGIDIRIQATLEDISATGCRVSTRAPLRIKHPVRIEFPRPGDSPLRMTGNVVRARTASEDRIYHYGILFRLDSDELRERMRSYVSVYAGKLARPQYGAVDRRSLDQGVDVKLSVDVSVPDVGRFHAIALALRPDGMRLACERVLRQEWSMKIDLRLPAATPAGLSIVTLRAKVRPGTRQVRGQYLHDVEFCETPLRVRNEIERFLYEKRATARERSR
jgi:c-di-GMP-binding flagellar brake protein YcgR